MSYTQFLQQRLRLLQIGGVKPLGEPAVDRGEEVAGFGGLALGVPEAGEVGGGTEFECSHFLDPGDIDCDPPPPCRLRIRFRLVDHGGQRRLPACVLNASMLL